MYTITQSTYSTLPQKAPWAPSYSFPRKHRGFTLHMNGLHSVYSFASGFFHELSSDFCFSTMPLPSLDTELPLSQLRGLNRRESKFTICFPVSTSSGRTKICIQVCCSRKPAHLSTKLGENLAVSGTSPHPPSSPTGMTKSLWNG